MQRLSAVLGLEIDEARWPTLVAAATFDQMRAHADERVSPVKFGLWKDPSAFFSSGSSGQWRSLLGPEELPRYEARLRELSTPDLAAWVHGGWRGLAS